jgi:hypothetical protein
MMLLLGKHQFLISSIDDLGGNSNHGNSNSTSNDQRGEKNKSQKTSSNLVIPSLYDLFFIVVIFNTVLISLFCSVSFGFVNYIVFSYALFYNIIAY